MHRIVPSFTAIMPAESIVSYASSSFTSVNGDAFAYTDARVSTTTRTTTRSRVSATLELKR